MPVFGDAAPFFAPNTN